MFHQSLYRYVPIGKLLRNLLFDFSEQWNCRARGQESGKSNKLIPSHSTINIEPCTLHTTYYSIETACSALHTSHCERNTAHCMFNTAYCTLDTEHRRNHNTYLRRRAEPGFQ